MSTAAIQIQRILIGGFIVLVFIISLGILEDRLELENSFEFNTLVSWIIFFIMILYLSLILIFWMVNRNKEKFLFLENWFSRESEEEMRNRLTAEMEEASVDNMGSKWAKMEMEHLEAKHSEE